MPFQPTTPAAGLVLAAAAVSLVGVGAGLAALALVAVAVAADAALARGRAPVVTRQLPAFVVRGVPAPMTVVAAGEGRYELLQPGTAAVAVQGQAPGGLQLVAARRGQHELPPVVARCRGPLRLATWTGPVTGGSALVVHPDVIAARRLARAATTTTFDEEAGRSRGPLGLGTSFESLRDYRPDDDVRLVNWKATARTGEPVVNQFRLEQARDVMLFLDAGRLMTAAVRGRDGATSSLFDAAVDAVTALALTADAIGDRCGLVAFADATLASLATRTGGGAAVARVAAALDARPVDADFESAFRTLPSKRALAVVLTDLGDEVTAAALLEAVPVLSRRHQVLVVTSEDRGLVEMIGAAASGAGSAADGARRAHRAVAAATLLEERARATALLRRAGARVVSAAPERLPAAACGAYLDLKRRARL